MKPQDRERLAGLLTSPPLAVSLLLLAVNDWYLKAAWGNWFTGKLSDFAGIFLLALLVFALSPRWRPQLAVGICLFIAWWKSPLSQPILDAINSTGLPRFGRVVDYSDLAALSMVPLAWLVVGRRERRPRAPHLIRRILAPPMAVACLAAMVATSPAINHDVFEIREVSRPMTMDRTKTAEAIRTSLEGLGMNRAGSNAPEESVTFSGGSTELKYAILDDARVRFHVRYQPNQGRGFADGYPGTGIREIRDALKKALDDTLGEIDFHYVPERYAYRVPSDAVQLKLVRGVFDEIARKNKLTNESPGLYSTTNIRGTRDSVRFWLRDEVTLEYTVHAMGLQNVPDEIKNALNQRFTGLQFYEFEKFIVLVDFENAHVIQDAK